MSTFGYVSCDRAGTAWNRMSRKRNAADGAKRRLAVEMSGWSLKTLEQKTSNTVL